MTYEEQRQEAKHQLECFLTRSANPPLPARDDEPVLTLTVEVLKALEAIEAALFAGMPENAATRVILLIARLTSGLAVEEAAE